MYRALVWHTRWRAWIASGQTNAMQTKDWMPNNYINCPACIYNYGRYETIIIIVNRALTWWGGIDQGGANDLHAPRYAHHVPNVSETRWSYYVITFPYKPKQTGVVIWRPLGMCTLSLQNAILDLLFLLALRFHSMKNSRVELLDLENTG